MLKISRRTLIKTALPAAAAFGAFPHIARAQNAATTFKYGNNLPLSHPLNVRAHEVATRIKEESKGRLVIDIFPNNQLGGDTDMMAQVRRGGIDIFTPSALVMSTLVPVAAINAVGFAFADYDQVWKAMDGKLGSFVRKSVEGVGLYAMDNMWDNGFRQVTNNNKPIEKPADLEGLKIRVPVSPIIVDMFKAMGAAPVGMQYSEVYSSLQTKVIDAQENPLVIIQTGKIFEVQKYCSLTNHIWDGYWFIVNGNSWKNLAPDLKEIMTEAFKEGAKNQRADIKKMNETVMEELKKLGLAFNQPQPDEFRAKLKETGFYGVWHKKFGDEAWGLLEEAVGKLS